MARKTLSQRIALTGGDEIQAQLVSIGKAGERAFARIKTAAEGANQPQKLLAASMARVKTAAVSLRATSDRVGRSFRTLRRGGSRLVSVLGRIVRRMGLLAAAAAGAAAAVAAVARSGAAVADQAAKTAEGLNLTIEELTRLRFAATQSGLTVEQFETALNFLNTKVADATKKLAAQGDQLGTQPALWAAAQEAVSKNSAALDDQTKSTGRAAQALKLLGIKLRDPSLQFPAQAATRTLAQFQAGLKSFNTAARDVRPTFDIFLDLADAFKAFPDGIEKAGLAAALFGETLGRKMLPFLNLGSEGIRELLNEADKVGATITQQQGDIGSELINAQGRLAASIKGLKDEIGLLFAPALTRAAERQTETIITYRKELLSLVNGIIPKAVALVEDLIAALSGRDADVRAKFILTARDAIIVFAKDAKAAFENIIKPAFDGLFALLDRVAVAVNEVFGTDLTGRQIAIAAVVAQLIGVFNLLGAAALAASVLIAAEIPGVITKAKELFDVLFGSSGEQVGGDVLAFGDNLTDFQREVLKLKAAVLEFVADAKAGFLSFVADVTSAFTDILFPVFRGVLKIFDQIAEGINFIFGTDFTGRSILIATAVAGFIGFLAAIGGALSALAAGIIIIKGVIPVILVAVKAIAFVAAVVTQALLGIALIPAAIAVAVGLAVAAIIIFWDDIKAAAQSAWDFVTGLWSDLADVLGGFAEDAADALVSAFKSAVDRVGRLLRNLGRAAAAAFKAAKEALGFKSGGSSSSSSGFSLGGGPLRGPGTKTSDSIPARLSRGEFVMRAAAVDRYGSGLFAALNSLRLPKVPGFSLGGLVDGVNASLASLAPMPAFATGGPALAAAPAGGNAGRPVTIVLDGQRFDLSAEDSVADSLTRTALRQQRHSAGRKPGWFGG